VSFPGGDDSSEMRAQNDYLWQQLDTLRRAPRKTWRRCRLHEVICAGCGRAVVEVMDTRPYPIVLHKSRDHGWGWFPISNPPPAADTEEARHGILVSICDCQQVTLSLGLIFDSLRRGEAKRVLPAPAGTLS